MIPRRVLGFGEQIAFLRLWWPQFQTKVIKKTLVSIGDICPMGLCGTYKVQVSQKGGKNPEVRVITPALRARSDQKKIPHMYSQESLCLFLPGNGEWKQFDPIALTILPWTSLWLYFYEVWHATGEWLGGGIHPEEHGISQGEEID